MYVHLVFILLCSPYYGYRRRVGGWVTFILLLVIIAVILSITLSLRYGTDSTDIESTKEYALTDKVIRSYNKDFCQGLTAMSTGEVPSSPLDATLYLLNSRPPLVDSESFNVSETANFGSSNNYHYWNFYLNNGSKLSFRACYDGSSSDYSVKFYLIQGSRNHQSWLDDPTDKSYAVKYKRLASQCQTVDYQIQKDALYFLSFYYEPYFVTPSTTLNIDFHFNRTVYHISQDNVAQNCSFPLDGFSMCSLGVSMSSGYTALISLRTTGHVDYDDGANIRINCEPRVWLYAVIVVGSIVPIVVVIVAILACVCIKIRKGKKRYTTLNSSTTPTANTASSNYQTAGTAATAGSTFPKAGEDASLNTAPPPYNPAYSSSTSGYGATTTTGLPPPYKE